jgi:dimeric dUTPase (all-alpha-NTP-PPase superfamily)
MLRGGAANPKIVDHWFSLLSQMIDEFSIVPELMFAMDETCCFINKSTRCFKVIGCSKQCSQAALKDENQETITLIPLISAAGHLYPPTMIFKGKQISKKAELPNPLGAS